MQTSITAVIFKMSHYDHTQYYGNRKFFCHAKNKLALRLRFTELFAKCLK